MPMADSCIRTNFALLATFRRTPEPMTYLAYSEMLANPRIDIHRPANGMPYHRHFAA